MIDVIAFDADDTLWHNETRYLLAKDRFKQVLGSYHHPETIDHRLDETEIRNLQSYGYGIKSFTLSMIETAIEISSGQIKGGDIQKIIEIAHEMLSAEVELFEHVEATLAELSRTFELMMITKGDLFEQESKIARSGLAEYFRYIEIVGEKSVETYRALLEKYAIDPERFVMVGNSIRSDILPVVELGGRAVYVPYAKTWFHENTVDQSIGTDEYFELDHLGQLPELIEVISGGTNR